MIDFLNNIMPNVIERRDVLWLSIIQSLQMVFISGAISFILGMTMGILLVVTRPGGILENKIIYHILDKLINIMRSIPFIILIAAMIPITRSLVGTAIGTVGAIPPLIAGNVPFFARQIEAALAEVNQGLIEAALSLGSSKLGVIFRVYLREGIPSIIRACCITFIDLIGLSAMAGQVGGGGLGDFAIRYGYNRNQLDITYVTVVIILLFILFIQETGNKIAKKHTFQY